MSRLWWHVCIPIENFNGITACLESGIKLGAVHTLELPTQGLVSTNASVQALKPSPRRLAKLLSVLNLSVDSLSPEELRAIENVVSEFQDVFALDDTELGCTNLIKHTIDTGDGNPIKQQLYRTLVVRRATMKQMIESMQAQGVVQPSLSPWSSPVVLVPKKDGSLRFVLTTDVSMLSPRRMFTHCHA